jgi:hypothetical protein
MILRNKELRGLYKSRGIVRTVKYFYGRLRWAAYTVQLGLGDKIRNMDAILVRTFPGRRPLGRRRT